MKRVELTVPAAMLAMLCLPVSATAQSSDELPPELLACAEETDVSRRLDCFDRELANLREAQEPEPETPPAPVADPAPKTAVAESVPEPAPTPEPAPAPVAAPAAAVTATATERETPTPPTAAVSAPVATAPVAATTATAPTTVESAPPPGATDPAPETESGKDFGLPSAGPDEISARVADIMKRPYGELVILLDNGQIWQQKHRDNRFRLDIGDDVTISEGLISGYRLSSSGRNNSIQVERLK